MLWGATHLASLRPRAARDSAARRDLVLTHFLAQFQIYKDSAAAVFAAEMVFWARQEQVTRHKNAARDRSTRFAIARRLRMTEEADSALGALCRSQNKFTNS